MWLTHRKCQQNDRDIKKIENIFREKKNFRERKNICGLKVMKLQWTIVFLIKKRIYSIYTNNLFSMYLKDLDDVLLL